MIVCKCCGEEARWCGPTCGIAECDQIHCDHCDMHYDCQNEAVHNAENFEEARAAMLAAYNKLERTPQTLKLALTRLKETQDALRQLFTMGNNERLGGYAELRERIHKLLEPQAKVTPREQTGANNNETK